MVMFIPVALKYVLLHSQCSTLVLAGVMIVVLCYYFCSEDKSGQAPGPRPWPILGSLHLMGGYKIPYAAFTALKVEFTFFNQFLSCNNFSDKSFCKIKSNCCPFSLFNV